MDKHFSINQQDLLIMSLVAAINSAIDLGDWKIDGRCDPTINLERATSYLVNKYGHEIPHSDEDLAIEA